MRNETKECTTSSSGRTTSKIRINNQALKFFYSLCCLPENPEPSYCRGSTITAIDGNTLHPPRETTHNILTTALTSQLLPNQLRNVFFNPTNYPSHSLSLRSGNPRCVARLPSQRATRAPSHRRLPILRIGHRHRPVRVRHERRLVPVQLILGRLSLLRRRLRPLRVPAHAAQPQQQEGPRQ